MRTNVCARQTPGASAGRIRRCRHPAQRSSRKPRRRHRRHWRPRQRQHQQQYNPANRALRNPQATTHRMPARDQIDEYIASIETYISSSFASVAPDIQGINDAINQLWRDVTRFGHPEMPDLHLPRALGMFDVPAPPPPPPPPAPPAGLCESTLTFVSRNRKMAGVVCVGAIGAGLLVGYSASAFIQARTRRVRGAVGTSSATRRLIVGMSLYSLPLVAIC